MKSERENKKDSTIVYSCYHQKSREGEQFVPEHILSYQISGSFLMNDGKQEHVATPGSIHLLTRNQLLKFTKYPPENGEFKSLSIRLYQDMLKSISLEYGLTATHQTKKQTITAIPATPILQSFFDSLSLYQQGGSFSDEKLIAIKQKEIVLLLLQNHPELKQLLFDFNAPHKIDLEAFMNQNFHFNVKAERFAYLTGRSLATFKRDFEKTFQNTPRKWLQEKRLDEAYYLINEKGKSGSEVYLDLGFEDLSHFSFVFKKKFGRAPSMIKST